MVLSTVKEDNDGFIVARWNTTYSISWDNILKTVRDIAENYIMPVIIVNDSVKIDIINLDDILKIKEAVSLTLCGMSKTYEIPIIIRFYNQLSIVESEIPSEFLKCDYEKVNKALGQYMDSIEIKMFK